MEQGRVLRPRCMTGVSAMECQGTVIGTEAFAKGGQRGTEKTH